jgi:hypothetical protein
MAENKTPSAIILPFGKHKGSTVADVLANDPQYVEWLLGQAWVEAKFAELHAAILTRGAPMDDTPEHNVIQARFLDPLFRAAFMLCVTTKKEIDQWRNAAIRGEIDRMDDPVMRKLDQESNYASRERFPKLEAERAERRAQIREATPMTLHFHTHVVFEHRGVDVLLTWRFTVGSLDSRNRGSAFFSHVIGSDYGSTAMIEIKPSLGDDFPTVMRQMERLGAWFLVIDQFAGRLPLETVRQMFAANGRKLITMREIEAEIANARVLVTP